MHPTFNYYLDAARYCREMGLPYTCIYRIDFRTLAVFQEAQ